jgi:hypothetical protein
MKLWRRENLPVFAGFLTLNRESPSLFTVQTRLSRFPYVYLGDKFMYEECPESKDTKVLNMYDFVVNISPLLSSKNSRHHFITFCRFITSP